VSSQAEHGEKQVLGEQNDKVKKLHDIGYWNEGKKRIWNPWGNRKKMWRNII